MPDATKKPIKKRGGWSAARQHLATWDKPALLALVKVIYDAAAVYRDFMQARCPAVVSGGEVLEKKSEQGRGVVLSCQRLRQIKAVGRDATHDPAKEKVKCLRQLSRQP